MEAGTEARGTADGPLPGGPRRIGHLRVVRGPAAPPIPGVFDLDVGPAGARYDEWVRAGGLLALQAIAPASGIQPADRARLSVLADGPGAALIGYAALVLGAKSVEVALHPEDREAFEAMAGREAMRRAVLHRRIDEAEPGAFHALAALGCDGEVPAIERCEPLVRRLRAEGQLLLFGLPADRLEPTFDELAKRGLSLRAMGIADGLAFLAGSLEGGDLD